MLEILNHEYSDFLITGKSILRTMSSDLPDIDTFVREVLQNSFDAKKKNENNIIEKVNCGTFDMSFSEDLADVEPKLNKYYQNGRDKYIAFSDYNTVGLDGPVLSNGGKNHGNFLSLVKSIAATTKTAAEGGSWGYGKTIYYRVGIGLVLFYSRIYENDKYEERLIACHIENEEKNSGLLYDLQRDSHTGIAWWGKLTNDNKDILPITDTSVIKKILNKFGLDNYQELETGTTIIIPYIDEKDILDGTLLSETSSENHIVNWRKNLADYIDVSIQRWYPTKYDNIRLDENYLKLYINGEKKSYKKMLSFFKIIQDIYNYSKKPNSCKIEDFEVKSEEIKVKPTDRIRYKSNIVGTFYYSYLDNDDLNMSNNESLYAQVTNSTSSNNQPRVFVFFCRKPGMILKYDYSGAWSGCINPDENGKYTIGFFIPNSDNIITIDGIELYLEDYLRATEKANHDDWKDYPEVENRNGEKVKTQELRIVDKVQKKIRSIMKPTTTTTVVSTDAINNLSKLLGDLFMPKIGGVKKAPIAGKAKVVTPKGPISKETKMFFENMSIESNECLKKNFKLEISDDERAAKFEFQIETDSGSVITYEEYSQNGNFPIRIKKINVDSIETYREGIVSLKKEINGLSEFNNIRCDFIRTISGAKVGFIIDATNNDDVKSLRGSILYEVIEPEYEVSLNKVKEAK